MWAKMRFGINKNVPWLKIGLPIVVGAFLILGVRGTFRKNTGEQEMLTPEAPMRVQVKVPEKVFRGSLVGKKLVALTFDDGPGEGTTTRLLDILKEKGAVATFFQLGMRMRVMPEVSQRAKEEGHEVESHTMYHQNLVMLSKSEAEADIREAQGVYREVLGEENRLTRMPYGNSSEFTEGVVGTPLLYWSVDSRDWESKDAEKVREAVVGTTRDGSVVLMHDIYDSTIEAIPGVIDGLRAEGFEFVTVLELAEERGVKLERGETYFSFYP